MHRLQEERLERERQMSRIQALTFAAEQGVSKPTLTAQSSHHRDRPSRHINDHAPMGQPAPSAVFPPPPSPSHFPLHLPVHRSPFPPAGSHFTCPLSLDTSAADSTFLYLVETVPSPKPCGSTFNIGRFQGRNQGQPPGVGPRPLS